MGGGTKGNFRLVCKAEKFVKRYSGKYSSNNCCYNKIFVRLFLIKENRWSANNLFLKEYKLISVYCHIHSLNTPFFISNTFISNTRLQLAKNKQKLSNTLRLNIGYLKIIHYLHPRYHPKIIGHIL